MSAGISLAVLLLVLGSSIAVAAGMLLTGLVLVERREGRSPVTGEVRHLQQTMQSKLCELVLP